MLDDPIPAIKRQLATEIVSVASTLNFHIAAAVLDIDPARLSDLRRGREGRFSIDRLIRLLAIVDRRVDLLIVNTGSDRVEWPRILRTRSVQRGTTGSPPPRSLAPR